MHRQKSLQSPISRSSGMNILRRFTIYQRLVMNAILVTLGIALLIGTTLYYSYDSMLTDRRESMR